MRRIVTGLLAVLFCLSATAGTKAQPAEEEFQKLSEMMNAIDQINGLDLVFGPRSAVLTPAALKIVKQQAAVLRRMGSDTVIEIESHNYGPTDEAANVELTEKRAQAVRQALIGAGLKPESLIAIGVGSAGPLVTDAANPQPLKKARIQYAIRSFPNMPDFGAKHASERSAAIAAANTSQTGPQGLRAMGVKCVADGETVAACDGIFKKLLALEPSSTAASDAHLKRAEMLFQKGVAAKKYYLKDEDIAFWQRVAADYAAAAEHSRQSQATYNKFDAFIAEFAKIATESTAVGLKNRFYNEMIDRNSANACARYHRVIGTSYFGGDGPGWDAVLSSFNGKEGAGCASDAALWIGRSYAEGDQNRGIPRDYAKAKRFYDRALEIDSKSASVAAWVEKLPKEPAVIRRDPAAGQGTNSTPSRRTGNANVNQALYGDALREFDRLIADLTANDAAYGRYYNAIARQIEDDKKTGVLANLFMKSERRNANRLLDQSRSMIEAFLKKYDPILDPSSKRKLQQWYDRLPYYIPI